MERKDMIQQIKRLVPELNRHRRLYYAENAPEISDQQYDQMFDALSELDKQSGCILFDSPTQMVGYQAVDHLEKATHPIPLLSLPNTKSIDDLVKFAGDHRFILMHKLGLTLKLTYENGSLVEASTRGDGKIGENMTHNARAIKNIPATIPYKGSLTVSGEAIIRYDDFDQMKDELVGSNGKPYKNPRNLAAGSVRLLDAKTCSKRDIHFYAFNVLSGLEDIADQLDLNSKRARLQYIRSLGFDVVRTSYIETCTGKESLSASSLKECLEGMIEALKTDAERSRLPIDGLVLSFDDVAYSKSLGRVRRYFKDGIAFKFEDEEAETVLRSVDWNVTRTGELSATAVFDPVELENTTVSRAVLHNLDIIEGHGLRIGHRIVVSKRMTTIPHVEQNMDKGKEGGTLYPEQCPSCGTALRYDKSPNAIHCPNTQCPGRKLSKLVHYAGEKALDIPGLSEKTLRKLMDAGYLDCEADLFALKQHRDSIVRLDGFGAKSVDKLLKDIEEHRTLSVERFITAMDTPA